MYTLTVLIFSSRVVFNREHLVKILTAGCTSSERNFASPSRLSPPLHTTAAGWERRNSHDPATRLFLANHTAHTCARRTSAALEVVAVLPHTTRGGIPFHTHQLVHRVEDCSFGFLVKQLPRVAHEELRDRILPTKTKYSEKASEGKQWLM